MARQARFRKEGNATDHHVMNRGSRSLPTFGDDDDRRRFLRAVDGCVERFDISIHSFALMSNHYHLVIEASLAALEGAMKRLGFLYTQEFNKKYNYDGPLFRGRYHSEPIQGDDHFLNVVRYVHRNPIDIDPYAPLSHYRWSSHGIYVGRRHEPPWLSTKRTLALFQDSRQEYRAFVENDQSPCPKLTLISVDEVEAAVATVTGCSIADIRKSHQGSRNTARLLVLLTAPEVCGSTYRDLADAYGIATPATARSAASRARKKIATDSGFAELYHAVLRTLGSVPDVRSCVLQGGVENVGSSD